MRVRLFSAAMYCTQVKQELESRAAIECCHPGWPVTDAGAARGMPMKAMGTTYQAIDVGSNILDEV